MVNRATSLESKIVPLLTVTVTIARATTVTRRPAAPLAPHVAARVRSGGHGGGFTSAYRTPAYGEHATALPELGKHGKCAPVRCWRASGCKPVTRANVLRSEIIRSRETGVYAGYSARRPDAVFHSTMFDEVMDEFAAKVAGLTDGDVWHACLRQLRRAAPPRPFQDKAFESSRGRSESRPSLAQRRARCSRSWMGAVDKSVHKLLRALLRRSGSHRMITIGSLSSSPSSSARKPARTLPIRTRVTTTTTTAAPPRIPTAANDAWRLYGRTISRLPVLPVRAPPPFALPGDICKRPGVFTRKKRTGPDFAGLPPG